MIMNVKKVGKAASQVSLGRSFQVSLFGYPFSIARHLERITRSWRPSKSLALGAPHQPSACARLGRPDLTGPLQATGPDSRPRSEERGTTGEGRVAQDAPLGTGTENPARPIFQFCLCRMNGPCINYISYMSLSGALWISLSLL